MNRLAVLFTILAVLASALLLLLPKGTQKRQPDA